MFYSGQKVVCIYDKEIPGEPLSHGNWGPGEALIKDKIYTINKIFAPYTNFPDVIVCTLFEMQRVVEAQVFGYLGYNVIRFRPLDERKTDISIFKGLLNPSGKKIEEEELV